MGAGAGALGAGVPGGGAPGGGEETVPLGIGAEPEPLGAPEGGVPGASGKREQTSTHRALVSLQPCMQRLLPSQSNKHSVKRSWQTALHFWASNLTNSAGSSPASDGVNSDARGTSGACPVVAAAASTATNTAASGTPSALRPTGNCMPNLTAPSDREQKDLGSSALAKARRNGPSNP